MLVQPSNWAARGGFLGRDRELARLEAWWGEPDAQPINLYGRRRVGKSWLVRRFAHGKPAIILVAERTTATLQRAKMADELEPLLGMRPEIRDIGELFKILYRLGSTERILIIVDEFPYLLGSNGGEVSDNLTSIQAALEQNRDGSMAKLIICGSIVTQMEQLQSLKSPLHGRFDRFVLEPMEFRDARLFTPTLDVVDQFTRYSISGGMPRYLRACQKTDLVEALAAEVVDSNSPLFNEAISVLQSELREPGVYLGILGALTAKPANAAAISAATGLDSKALSPYLERLANMGLIRRRLPVGAATNARSGQWQCRDEFMRFWFRFVRPYQADLEAGADARHHVNHHIVPRLAEHTAGPFEEALRRWIRREFPSAAICGPWWGHSLHAERRAGTRQTEEIDAVALRGKSVVVVAEAKWTNAPMALNVLADLDAYKLPALEQAGLSIADGVQRVLTSRSGFSRAIQRQAAGDSNIRLISAVDLLEDI